MSYKTEVSGENDEHDVKLFAISTCGWCKKVKELLREEDIEFEYVNIDEVEGEESKEVRQDLKRFNSSLSCPTLVIDNGREVIIGFQEDKIRGELCDEE